MKITMEQGVVGHATLINLFLARHMARVNGLSQEAAIKRTARRAKSNSRQYPKLHELLVVLDKLPGFKCVERVTELENTYVSGMKKIDERLGK